MSVRVLTKVFQHSEARLAARLVLLALADAAHDDGIVWLSQQTVADKTKTTRQTVSRTIEELTALGELEVRKAQRGQRRINVYRVTMPGLADPDYDRLPFALDSPFDDVRISSVDDVAISSVAVSDPSSFPARATALSSLEPSLDPKESERARPGEVDRRTVTDREWELSVQVLAVWNQVAGTAVGALVWSPRIIMRIREHPELSLADHEAVIRTAFADPWWKGSVTPAVVYGNGPVFDNALVRVNDAPGAGRGLTPEEVGTYGSLWGPGTGYDSLAAARAAGSHPVIEA